MPRTSLRPAMIAAPAAAAVLSGTLGCGNSSAGHGSSDSALAQAMAEVSGSGPAATYFEFGHLAALRKAGIVHADQLRNGGKIVEQRWNRVAGIGSGSLATYIPPLPDAIGLNILAADTALSIGNPPNTAVRFDGSFDAKAITGKLRGLGAKARTFGSTQGLSFAADNAINPTSALSRRLMLVNQLNQVVVTKDAVVASPNAASLARARGQGDSLLDTGSYRQLADCLGDVAAAVIERPEQDDRVSVIGVGVLAPKSAASAAHEVVCAVPTAGSTNQVRAAYAVHLRPSGFNPINNDKLSSDVTAGTVSTRGKLVRAELTLRDSEPAGYALAGLNGGLAPYWDGSCTAIDVAQKRCR